MNIAQHPAPRSNVDRGFSFARRALFSAAALLLVACQPAAPTATPTPAVSPSHTVAPATGATPTATALASPTQSPSEAGAYPLELVDDEGTTVTLTERPGRIVSLTPATTEIVFALDAGDRLVGRGDFDDYPPVAMELPGVATFTGVEHEALLALDPDLVLAGGNNFTAAADIERMRELGLAVLVLYAPTVEAVLADIELIGRAIDAEPAAAGLVSGMRQRIDEVKAAVAGLHRPRVFYQIGSEPEIYGPAPGSFIADMVALAGGFPVTTGDPVAFAMPLERLVALDPELIVLGDAQYGVCPADVASRPGWGTITAVEQGRIVPVYDTIVTRPGPRLAEGLAALALAIHPDADIDPPAGDMPDLCGEGGP